MLSATFDDRGGGANYPAFSMDLTRSRAIFHDPEILYIIRRTCCTSQGDPDSSFPCGITRSYKNTNDRVLNWNKTRTNSVLVSLFSQAVTDSSLPLCHPYSFIFLKSLPIYIFKHIHIMNTHGYCHTLYFDVVCISVQAL